MGCIVYTSSQTLPEHQTCLVTSCRMPPINLKNVQYHFWYSTDAMVDQG